MARLARITDAPLDLAQHLAAVDDVTCGAVVTFVGRVRNHDPEAAGEVVAVEYYAHRLFGEIALLACVATAHRREAHVVSLGLVEEIKASLAVWKRQVEAGGAARWIGA